MSHTVVDHRRALHRIPELDKKSEKSYLKLDDGEEYDYRGCHLRQLCHAKIHRH